jgi:excisionase family DNA binding protein
MTHARNRRRRRPSRRLAIPGVPPPARGLSPHAEFRDPAVTSHRPFPAVAEKKHRIGGHALYGDGMAAPAPRVTDPAARQLALDFRTRRRERADAMTARLLTADDLAERWQVPKSHVYRLTRDARIPTVKLGRYYRYRLDAIEAFELGATVPAADNNGRGATADRTPA